jgi:hypothetical protein
MIEMQCPSCGAEGRIPKEKVNTRLVCKKCLKVFHVTASGRAVLGEPAPSSSAAAMTKEPAAPDRAQEVDQWFDRLGKRLTSPKNLGALAALILVCGILTFLSLRKTETLQERVTKVATAAVQGDLQTIRSMSAAGTGDEAVKWYDAVRPQCDELRQRLGASQLVIDVNLKQPESEQGGSSEVVATLDSQEQLQRRGRTIPDPTIAVTAGTSQPLALPMSWKNEGWSGWRLDGKRTLELAAAAP